MHRILLRQIKRAFGEAPSLSDEWQELLQMVSETYDTFDRDRVLIERSLEISSKELRLVVATMRTTLDSVGEGVLVIDQNNKIAYCNKRFGAIWDMPLHDVSASETEQAFESMSLKTSDPEFFKRIVSEASDGLEIEADVTMKLQNHHVISIKSYPQLLEGKTVGRVWSFRDITKYVSFQEDIQDKVATLERLNKTMVDRELKMIELKSKIEALEQQGRIT